MAYVSRSVFLNTNIKIYTLLLDTITNQADTHSVRRTDADALN